MILLASQAIDVLEGKEGNFRCRQYFSKETNEITMWPDPQLDDYRYCHGDLEHVCYYEQMMGHEKIPKMFKEIQNKSPRAKSSIIDNETIKTSCD